MNANSQPCRDFPRSLCSPLIAAGLALLAFAPGAAAQDVEEPWGHNVELLVGLGFSSSDDDVVDSDVNVYGLRYTYDFNGRWGLEVGYSVLPDFSYYDEDAQILEASLRFRLWENDRVALFALAGGGVLRYGRRVDPGTFIVVDDENTTNHVGLAMNISLGESFYLRPDLRYRRLINVFSPIGEDATEATFAVGYRF